MARRKSVENVSSEESTNLVASLIEGSSFEFVSSDKGSLTDRPYVETPIIALNCLLGGGLPLGSLVEVFGPNASGKSSILYETLGNFQKKYPNGVAFIVDTESSTDDTRLRQLGVDPSRAPRTGAPTLEDGFNQITNILTKMANDSRYDGFPVMIMWDTIANSGLRTQINEGADYNRMVAMERARILKYHLMKLFPLIEKLNVLIVLLNQATVDMSGFHPGITSSGGNALQHNIHLRIKVDGGQTEYDGVFPAIKNSKLSLLKSKISPLMNNFRVRIDIRNGGTVNKNTSLTYWMIDLGLWNNGAWWTWKDEWYQKYKPYIDKFPVFEGNRKFRQVELWDNKLIAGDQNFIKLLSLIWTDLICENYSLQSKVCSHLRTQLIADLMNNLGLTYEDINRQETTAPESELVSEDSQESVEELLEALTGTVDTSTGEIVEGENDGQVSE